MIEKQFCNLFNQKAPFEKASSLLPFQTKKTKKTKKKRLQVRII